MISHSHKFIFRHYGKSAGSSIKRYFREKDGVTEKCSFGHKKTSTLQQIVIDDGYDPEEYIKFCCCRNPWDRGVSAYYHFKKFYRLKDLSFEEFVVYGFHQYSKSKQENNEFSPCLIDGKRAFHDGFVDYDKFDYIIRFENLQEDFLIFCDKLNIEGGQLPHVDYNTKRPKLRYQDYYTKKTIDIVAQIWKKEIEKFNYKYN